MFWRRLPQTRAEMDAILFSEKTVPKDFVYEFDETRELGPNPTLEELSVFVSEAALARGEVKVLVRVVPDVVFSGPKRFYWQSFRLFPFRLLFQRGKNTNQKFGFPFSGFGWIIQNPLNPNQWRIKGEA